MEAFFASGRLAGRARVRNPLAESEHSEPQPDLMLMAERTERYADGHPAPEEVLLLVEVADSRWPSTGAPRFRSTPPTASAKCGWWT